MHQIIPTAEPFFFPASSRKIGCLLVHGFTGTPKEMRWMGEYLAQHSYTSLGVRLAGHATHPADMIRSRYTDWLASLEDGYAMLRGWVDRVVMIGLSMGGILALLSSTRLETAGVVAISTPYALPPDPRLKLIKTWSLIYPYRPKSKLPPGTGWIDHEAWEQHVTYPMHPVRSFGELDALLAEMRLALPEVSVPVLLIHSRDDDYVIPVNAERIFSALGSADKQKVYISGSGHVLTEDAARTEVFETALNFVRRLEEQP